MTTPTNDAEASVVSAEPAPAVRLKIFLYLGALIVLLAFAAPNGGLIDIPVSFLLKNKLHLDAHALAEFRVVAGMPLYLSCAFGFVRDTWNPLGMRDRGFMMLFGIAGAALYAAFAFVPVGYGTLLAALLLLTAAFLFVSSAQNGLTSALGQQNLMSGQISAVWNIFGSLPTIAALLVGGMLSNTLERMSPDAAARTLFLLGGSSMAAVALYGAWKPRSVFRHVHAEADTGQHPLHDLKRLLRHRPIYPALLIWLIWNFAPGSATPLQFYLQNTLHAADAAWGEWNAIFAAAFIPSFLVFGLLCHRFPLRTFLVWGTVIAVPQFVPLLFAHSVASALAAAVPMGLMGGTATAAYLDLIIRSCPPGLQGTMLMMSGGLYFMAARFGDVLGTSLYARSHGFTVCIIAITIVYALILPTLILVPPSIIATRDGEAPAKTKGDR